MLAIDDYNRVCLDHPSFACGGTDCKGYCAPFRLSPKQRYRFVGRVEYAQNTLGSPPVLRVERVRAAP